MAQDLSQVPSLARTKELHIGYSPLVALELLCYVDRGGEQGFLQRRKAVRILLQTCEHGELPHPEAVIEQVVGRPAETTEQDRGLAEVLTSVAKAKKLQDLVTHGWPTSINGGPAIARLKSGSACGLLANARCTFVHDLLESRQLLHLFRTPLNESLAFLDSADFPLAVFRALAGRSGVWLVGNSQRDAEAVARIDAFVAGYRSLMRKMVAQGYKPKKHKTDTEDLLLLLYAALGYTLVTKDRRLCRSVEGSLQEDMVWHWDDTLDRLRALR